MFYHYRLLTPIQPLLKYTKLSPTLSKSVP